ncbi:glucose 1-dehydrogenase [Dendronalium sp. ChiSLP03b]|uniref:glucose 1-dehydrogenase n=1 Tax=Dendronalium sp. ChiSLP03b TaxID=3075381 RepID=UPI002AD33A07|nr:glucose 1-dehydrogenase [Dendronalium sp. ChiSLP03b]MDZ8203161.1 glucose 1-dehydrogenase [Dendronalium sp. ChiSLP03b]
MSTLTGKVAIVTGAARGIGRTIAERLADDGASVAFNYSRSATEAQELISTITAKGGKALAVQADMSQVADIRRFFQKTLDKFGQLDILVNNAGIATSSLISDVTEEEYEKVFAVNVRGVLFALQEASRHMNDRGRIINISSSTTIYPQAGLAVYIASKETAKTFTHVLAKELGGRGITVNSVMPGGTIPGMFDGVPDELKQAAIASSFGRLGYPTDIADVIAFLVSEKARWINGQEILVNGNASF